MLFDVELAFGCRECHLPRLAEALSVSADDLMRAPERTDPRVQSNSFTRDGITYWPLTRQGPTGGLHAYKIRVSARRRTPPAKLPVHEGQEWLYVLSGRLRLLLGEEEFTIKPGEAVEFSTRTPHWFGPSTDPWKPSQFSACTANAFIYIPDPRWVRRWTPATERSVSARRIMGRICNVRTLRSETPTGPLWRLMQKFHAPIPHC